MDEKIMGRCMKCKEQREMASVEIVKMKKTGAPAAKGKCVKCGTGMYKILSKDHPAAKKAA